MQTHTHYFVAHALTHEKLVSLVAIMFELTGGLDFVAPIMLAVVVAVWVGNAINVESKAELTKQIYIHHLNQ